MRTLGVPDEEENNLEQILTTHKCHARTIRVHLERLMHSAKHIQDQLANQDGTALLWQEKDEESARQIHVLVRWLEGLGSIKESRD